ncbi:MAG: ATP-binding protein [Oligoflexales bacterium]|nr:ATP-binding protein [Oligoflexales bacterium]
MWIERKIQKHLSELLTQFPALLLTGARQTGKTSLLRKMLPHYAYVSLDTIQDAELADRSPEQFLLMNPPPLIIDEVQYAPGLFRSLKKFIDNNRHSMGQFVLTGSQKFSLMQKVSESLAGRIAIQEIETLSLEEISQSQNLESKLLPKLLVRGGFPELWRNPDMSTNAFFRSYVQTYLERDLQQLLQVTKLRDFDRFLRLLATRHAQTLNKADLAKDLGLAPSTIGEWVSVLEASNIIESLEPFYFNIGKRLIKNPKIYFQDSGLVCYLLQVQETQILSNPFLGALWEGLVYSELRKQHPEEDKQIYFYRDQQAKEVDFLLLQGGVLHMYEVKWNELPSSSDSKNLTYLHSLLLERKDLPFQIGKVSLVSTTETSFPLNDRVWVISYKDLNKV